MHVLASRIELHLPGSGSLKDKRSRLRPILDGGRHRFPVSVAEVAKHDSHRRATLGTSTVSGSVTRANEVMDEFERFVWSFPDVEVMSTQRDWMELDA